MLSLFNGKYNRRLENFDKITEFLSIDIQSQKRENPKTFRMYCFIKVYNPTKTMTKLNIQKKTNTYYFSSFPASDFSEKFFVLFLHNILLTGQHQQLVHE